MPLTRDDFGPDRDGRQFFPQTGHGITGLFAAFWQQNGGLGVFGFPLSEQTREVCWHNKQVTTVQYFERARFELTKDASGKDTIRLANLGARVCSVARTLGVNPVPKDGGAQEFSTSLWPKWIDVNLKSQHLMAYEGNTVIQQFDITSGEPRTRTPTGVFQIFAKLKSDRMKGHGLPPAMTSRTCPGRCTSRAAATQFTARRGAAVYGPGTEAAAATAASTRPSRRSPSSTVGATRYDGDRPHLAEVANPTKRRPRGRLLLHSTERRNIDWVRRGLSYSFLREGQSPAIRHLGGLPGSSSSGRG